MNDDIQVKGMLSYQDFLRDVEEIVYESGTDYVDAVLDYCARNGVEVETAAAMVRKSESLRSKLQREAEDLRLIPRTAKLPVEYEEET